MASFVPEPIEKCAVCGVAQQHGSIVVPDPVHDLRKVEPERAVREQLVALEVAGEEPLAEREGLILVQLVEAGPAPRRAPGIRR